MKPTKEELKVWKAYVKRKALIYAKKHDDEVHATLTEKPLAEKVKGNVHKPNFKGYYLLEADVRLAVQKLKDYLCFCRFLEGDGQGKCMPCKRIDEIFGEL